MKELFEHVGGNQFRLRKSLNERVFNNDEDLKNRIGSLLTDGLKMFFKKEDSDEYPTRFGKRNPALLMPYITKAKNLGEDRNKWKQIQISFELELPLFLFDIDQFNGKEIDEEEIKNAIDSTTRSSGTNDLGNFYVKSKTENIKVKKENDILKISGMWVKYFMN